MLTSEDWLRLRRLLKKAVLIGGNRNYGARIIRVLTVPDMLQKPEAPGENPRSLGLFRRLRAERTEA